MHNVPNRLNCPRPTGRMHRTLSMIVLALVAFVESGCGRILYEELNEDQTPGSPTLSRFSTWEHIWKTGSWIAALDETDWQASESQLLGRYRGQTLELLGQPFQGFGIGVQQKVQGLLDSKLHLELIRSRPDLPAHPALLAHQSTQGRPLTFLHIQLTDPERTFRGIERFLGEPFVNEGNPRRRMAFWQKRALIRFQGLRWVEPNLYSVFNHPKSSLSADETVFLQANESTENSLYRPPEFEFRSLMVNTLRLIKADLAYDFKGEGVERRRPVNVAVLDTGVDHEHPDLREQMWTNQLEIPDNGQDDDQNGIVDDVHGFDATLGPNLPKGVEPRPGSADLGGPGSACPAPAESVRIQGDLMLGNCGHGTHVAGIIAAQHGSDPKTLGVCPNCRIMSLRVSERCLQPETQSAGGECVTPRAPLKENQYEVDGNISDVAQIRALQYLFNTRKPDDANALEVNIVNMSLGKYFRSRTMAYLIQSLQDANVIVVAASGNEDTDTPSYPAAYESVVAVCATSSAAYRGNYAKASFSNFGEWVDICAPGRDILSTFPGVDADGSGKTEKKPGTSQATPFVAGALGYLLSTSPSQVGAKEIVRKLKQAATYNVLYFSEQNLVPGTETDSAYLACYEDGSSCDYLLGTGFLNLHKAVNPNAQDPFSQVDFNNIYPVESGCVISTIGHRPFSLTRVTGSMPFLLLLAFGILRLLSPAQRKTR